MGGMPGGFHPGMGGMGGDDEDGPRKEVDNEKFYKILGVGKNASQGEIKKAYMKLAKEVGLGLARWTSGLAMVPPRWELREAGGPAIVPNPRVQSDHRCDPELSGHNSGDRVPISVEMSNM